MSINKNIQDAINDQINAEMFSAYLYLSMAAWFEFHNLPGFGNWMTVQAQEEMAHAKIFYNYVIERGGQVILKAIDAPSTDWSGPEAIFAEAYAHEQKVTARINALMDLARKENDHASVIRFEWFVTEQVEEEASVDKVIQKLKMVGDNSQGLFMIDNELGTRVYTPPATEA
jgi:ferritin